MGISKRKYDAEKVRYNKSIKRPLYQIYDILPIKYDGKILLEYFKKYYPFEWDTLVQMQKHYKAKDDFLKSKGKKIRYRPLQPEKYFFALPVVKYILSQNMKLQHKQQFDDHTHEDKFSKFESVRILKINKRTEKIANNNEKLQFIDPLYVDLYIAAYHSKDTTTEEKIEIVKDLSHYNSEKVNTFFYKLNDSERNNQVRRMAFDILQKRGKYVKLRKNFKGKKKTYMIETFKFNMTPKDLYDRLQNRSIQDKKKYNVFISHSYSDQKIVLTFIKFLNQHNLSCYCDWTCDTDFLKRTMAGKYTEEVLKYRIEQSEVIMYIKSEKSEQSKWVQFELEYAKTIGKQIIFLNLEDVITENINVEILNWRN